MVTDLERMPKGVWARVLGVDGGWGVARKLEDIGLREGKRIRKVSSQLMAGPVTVLVDGRQVAMGRGIARRVRVEVED
jgi:ferrous iron transport protein A